MCCFWSAQGIERQAGTSATVRTWVFTSLSLQSWSFIDIVLYWNILLWIKAAFLELEKAMFTVGTLVPMFTTITPGPFTHSKQSKTFHAKCTLKLNCEKKMSLITKSDSMSVTELNHAVGHLCHVVDVYSKLLKDFNDYSLFNVSDQLVVGLVFSCFWLINNKNMVLLYSMNINQYFCVDESLK